MARPDGVTRPEGTTGNDDGVRRPDGVSRPDGMCPPDEGVLQLSPPPCTTGPTLCTTTTGGDRVPGATDGEVVPIVAKLG